MEDALESTPEQEPVEVELPKTGAEAWKERRALILSRNSAARDRSRAPSARPRQRAGVVRKTDS